jgi:hypothetical protein
MGSVLVTYSPQRVVIVPPPVIGDTSNITLSGETLELHLKL